MRRISLAFLTTVCWLVPPASACDCIDSPRCANFSNDTAIFLGRLIKAAPGFEGPFTFEVVERFKGLASSPSSRSTVQIRALPCDRQSLANGEYLIQATRLPDGELYFDGCHPPAAPESVVEELKELREWNRGDRHVTVRGVVTSDSTQQENDGIANTKVTVTRAEQSFVATTDAKGEFQIRLPQPGQYRLASTKPGWQGETTTISIPAQSCASVRLTMIER